MLWAHHVNIPFSNSQSSDQLEHISKQSMIIYVSHMDVNMKILFQITIILITKFGAILSFKIQNF